jgi:hypothetical protein
MKRDLDIVRGILLEIEKQSSWNSEINLQFDAYSPEEVSYHVMLLHEAGLIVGTDLSSFSDLQWIPVRLTWQGHEFLDAAKDDNRWSKAKAAMGKVGGFVFEIGKQLLIELAKAELKQQNLLP